MSYRRGAPLPHDLRTVAVVAAASLALGLGACASDPGAPTDGGVAGDAAADGGAGDASSGDGATGADGGTLDAAPADAMVPLVNGATFVAQSFPTSIEAGLAFSARVTMRNTGTTVWSRVDGHYLGTSDPMDDVTFGTNRAMIVGTATVPPGMSYDFTLQLRAPTAPGTYHTRWRMLQDAVEWFGDPTDAVTIVVTEPTIPTVDELRAFRGDFGGIQLPELVPQCPEDPVSHVRCEADDRRVPVGLGAGALFTPAYGTYSVAQRAAIRAAYRARGYTHFPISIFCDATRWYHGIYPPLDCTQRDLWLQELRADRLIPVCFVLPDGALSTDLSGVDKTLCPIVVPMWEMNGPLAEVSASINEAITFTRSEFPDALLYVHFTPEHAAGGVPEADWWTWATQDPVGPHVQGILYQDDRWTDPQAVKDRVLDFLLRLGGGYHGWPHPVDVVLFETDIYPKFWDGLSEEDSVVYNDQILEYLRGPECYQESGVTYCGQLAGFCSGGTP